MTKTMIALAIAASAGIASAQPIVAFYDDDGIGLLSVLSFGTGSGQMLGDSFNLGGDGIANGENGAVPAAGSYTLAIGSFDINFEDIADFSEIDATGENTFGAWTLEVYTDAGTQSFSGSFAEDEFSTLTLTFDGTETFVDIAVTSADFDSEIALFQVPAPASAGLLGLGGLIAARRRRA